jgi:hypothetical protein
MKARWGCAELFGAMGKSRLVVFQMFGTPARRADSHLHGGWALHADAE